jgi:hypothetical protein
MANRVSRNLTYDRLVDQVKIEYEIGRSRESITDQGFALLCDFAYEENDHLKKSEALLEVLTDKEVKVSNVLEYSLLLHLKSLHDKKVSSDILDKVKYYLQELVKSQSYPIGNKGLILYLIKDVPELKGIAQKMNSSLLKRAASLFNDNRNIELVIDTCFACEDQEGKLSAIDLHNELKEKLNDLPRDKVAKSILYLSKVDDLDLSELIDGLEEKINQDFSNWIKPDIWLAIIESEKLVNSNLPQEELEKILKNLKESKSDWSQKIESIEKGGVFLNLGEISRSPNFSPLEDSLCLLALKRLGKDKVIQLSQKDAKDFENYKILDKKGLITDLKSVNRFGVFIMLNIILSTAILLFYLDSLNELFVSFWETKTNPKSPKEIISYIFNPVVIILINFWWLYLVWRRFTQNGTLIWKEILLDYPIVKYLIKFFHLGKQP